MDAMENLLTRRSCRAYTEEPVARAVVERIVEAGRFAPSGMGRQPTHFVIVQDKAARDELSRLNAAVMGSDDDPFYGAGTVVIVLVDDTVSTSEADGALAMGNMLNAAHALGIGSCWINRAREVFASEEGRALLAKWGLPADGSLRGVGNCILGYPAGDVVEAPPRKENVAWV